MHAFDTILKLVRDTLGEILLKPLLPIIHEAPDPALALNGLHRLASAKELPIVLKQGRIRELIKILGFSPFFTTTLAVRPQLLTELFMGNTLDYPKDEAAMLRELDRLIPGDAPLEVLQRELRRFKRQEALRIAARDLCQIAKVPEITAEIADLASASLHKALSVCEHLARSRYGTPHENGAHPAELVILGMGKLGGRELNFSSDIDLICFSSSSEGETKKGVPLTVYFRRLVNLLIKAISQPTADGFVFRVDLGLRPEGRSGEIAQSLSFAENYYENWGQAWERFALLKARPVAGNLALGEKLLTTLRPFIYRRYLDFGMVEELKQMQHKIREALRQRADQGDDDIKLGRGGIREIEFFVQTLQQIHAGKHPRLRHQNTLEALERLREGGFVSLADARALEEAYLFLRMVENHVQIVQEQQTHTLPADTLALARSCGCGDAAAFHTLLEKHRHTVESICHNLFSGDSEENVGDEARQLLDPATPPETVEAILSRRGCPDIEISLRDLALLRDGPLHFQPGYRLQQLRQRVMPAFVQAALASKTPEMALRNGAILFTELRSRTSIFALLAENPDLIRLLARILATSTILARFFIDDPEALDALAVTTFAPHFRSPARLAHDLRESIANCGDYEEKLDALRRFRHEEFLRIALADIRNEISRDQAFERFSVLADVCLEQAAAIARGELLATCGLPRNAAADSAGEAETGLAIVALGKLGSYELDYSSELDLMFLFEDEGKTAPAPGTNPARFRKRSNHEYFMRLVRRILAIVMLRTDQGQLFQIDGRQRHSGYQGPMVSSFADFVRFHRHNTTLEERLILSHARVVTAPPNLRAALETSLAEIVYPAAQLRDFSGDLPSSPAGEPLDTLDFLARMLQLRHGPAHPELRATNTAQLLAALHATRIIEDADYHDLETARQLLLTHQSTPQETARARELVEERCAKILADGR